MNLSTVVHITEFVNFKVQTCGFVTHVYTTLLTLQGYLLGTFREQKGRAALKIVCGSTAGLDGDQASHKPFSDSLSQLSQYSSS